MSHTYTERFTQVVWIGGATDTGKSSVAQSLAERHGMYVYHFDKSDAEHHRRLAETVPEVRRFLNASLDERWIHPEPNVLLEYLLIAFSHRFPLALENILNLPNDKPVVAEGFGLLPELVHPMLSSPYQAIWFVPTEKFKWESMTRRGKPSFATQTSDPEKAKMNLFARDMLLADYYCQQVPAYGYRLIEIDGSRSTEEVTDLAYEHFSKYRAILW